MLADSPTFALSLALVAAAILLRNVLLPQHANLPPSPPSDPLIGNARVMPLEYAFKTFGEWSAKYGDVIYAAVLGRPMLIINSAAAARDLMEKRGAIYSSRPTMWVMGVLMGWSKTLPFLKYGDTFRKHRRMMQQHFGPGAVHVFRPIQQAQVLVFLRRLLANPDNFSRDTSSLIAGTILKATYGYEVRDEDDPYVTLVNKATKMTTDSGSPGGTIIDLFPSLRYLPESLLGLKRHARLTSELVAEIMEMPLRELKEKRAKGISPPCYVSYLLDEYESSGKVDKEHEENIRHVSAVIYSAGVETTEATLKGFLLFMTTHPEVVAKAQAEIDAVCGAEGRLPLLEDRPRLPYIDCIIKESFRMNPAVPICIPHESTKADSYRGWTIPEGSMIIPNIWKMMRDERFFPEPEKFNPDRYRGKSALQTIPDASSGHVDGEQAPASSNLVNSQNVREDDPNSIVFGFGRRMCPGRHFAEVTIWLMVSSFLAAFDISPAIDEATGKPIPVEIEFLGGTSSQPKPFRCSIRPRSERWKKIIQEAC